jgi:hypothetical protein
MKSSSLTCAVDNFDAVRNVVLFDIIGATDLHHPHDDQRSETMHPFVVATLLRESKKEVLIRTKRRKGTCNPIWSLEHRCLFLLDVTDTMLVNKTSCTVKFDVRDKDAILSDPFTCTLIGSVEMSLDKIMHACEKTPEERIELQLNRGCTDKDNVTKKSCEISNEDMNTLAVRVRFATGLDRKLMQDFNQVKDEGRYKQFPSFWKSLNRSMRTPNIKTQQVTDVTPNTSSMEVGVNGLMNMVSEVQEWKSFLVDGIRRERIQPYPDPLRPYETRFLSHADMEKEVYRPSTKWKEYGTTSKESLGQLFVEVLRCENLPNMDTGEALGNKTDAFACVIFEEALAQTEVIDDRLSPMWMPWTERAFCFNMMHPFSQLFVSVNDYDVPPSSHDGIGRIAVNLNHFESNVTYTLTYELHPTANLTLREVSTRRINDIHVNKI